MDRREKAAFVIGVFLEVVGMGIGVIDWIPNEVGYGMVILSIPFLIYALYTILRYKPLYTTWQEVKARGEARRYYLEPLGATIDGLINLYDEFANKACNLPLTEYDDKYYRSKYDRKHKHYNRKIINRMEGNSLLAPVTITLGWSFVSNNPYFAELKKKNTPKSLISEYIESSSHIIDKRLAKYLNNLWNSAIRYNSIKIFYELRITNLKENTLASSYINRQQELIKKEFNTVLNDVKTRIDELLGGVPDER